jgi:3-oxoacyl-[acyl-carrier protein] reductase
VIAASRHCSADLADLISRNPGRLEHHAVDLAKPDAVSALSQSAGLIHGVDGFVANAAIAVEGLLTLMSERAIRECVQVNLMAPMLLAREAIKGMLSRGGNLVFISSVAARSGISGLAVYGATKAGLSAFSRAISREYGERGVRANVIVPGFINTEMSQTVSSDGRAQLIRRTPLQRLGETQDVVGAVSFLLSNDARFITGTEILVDGGFLS